MLGSLVWQRFVPLFSAPAKFERSVLQRVNGFFLHRGKASLECGEPVILPPVKGNGAQRAAREFGERVMGGGFPAVQKERNCVTTKFSCKRLMAAIQIPDNHSAITKTISGTDEL